MTSTSQDTVENQQAAIDWRSITAVLPTPVWISDQHGLCVWCNEAWLEFTGQSREQAIREGRHGTLHPDDRETTDSAFAAAFAQRDSIEVEYRLQHHGGGYRWVLERAVPHHDSEGTFCGYVCMCLDVSIDHEQRRLAAERESMLQRLHNLSERERTFLSCAIHDGILQDIIGTDMLLQGLDQASETDLVSKLSQAKHTLHSAVQHGRKLISQLRPMILDERGLVAAIELYATEIQNRSGLQFSVIAAQRELEVQCPLWDVNVFRVVQEAMNNVETHSQAETASIGIQQNAGSVHICISDDGVGFDVEAQRDSFGLRCMYERVELFAGSLGIDSSPGRGCRVQLVMPLPIA